MVRRIKICCECYLPEKVRKKLKKNLLIHNFILIKKSKLQNAIRMKLSRFVKSNGKEDLWINGMGDSQEREIFVKYPSANNKQSSDFKFALVVLHEIYHALGLKHCKNMKCLMGKGKNKSDYAINKFEDNPIHYFGLCNNCRKILRGNCEGK